MTAPTAARPRPSDAADAVTLEAGGSRVAIEAARGGRVTRLCLAGREWLPPDHADAGYGECLPTVGACTVDVPGAGAVAFPDGGELWTRDAVTERVDAPAGAAAAVTRWTGERMPYAFSRTVTVQPDGAVRLDYALESRAAEPVPVLWAPHPAVALRPATRLDLPVAARVRVWDARGLAVGGRGAEHRWPILRVGDARATPFGPREADFTFPALPQLARAGADGAGGYACTLFLDLPRTPGKAVRLGVEQDGARLEVAVDPGEVPYLRLRIERAAAPDARGDVGTLVLAPCLAAGDRLDTALDPAGGWGPPVWLAPGAARRWTLTWRGRAAPAGA